MDFKEQIKKDIEERNAQLAILRLLTSSVSIPLEHREFIIKYSPAIVYALWEGFVNKSFSYYIKTLNRLKLKPEELKINLLTYAIMGDDKLKLDRARKNSEKQQEFVEYIQDYLKKEVKFSSNILTKSNVNYEIINNILENLGIEKISEKYEKELDNLLDKRNHVAHGDSSVTIEKENILKSCDLITNLMDDVFANIKDAYDNETYLKI